jgi:endonuclease G, mitochondrial
MLKRLLSVLLAISVFLPACDKKDDNDNTPVNPPQPGDNDHILLGNPTNATTNAGNGNNYFKDNVYYKIGYSSSRGIPIWVSWHLQSSDIGSTPRQDDFRPDNLPSSYYAVTTQSYNSSGFDRGHNCPSGDRTSSVAANSSTFLMTNIIPQAPNFNQGPWEGLEDYVRNTLVGNNNEAFIVSGNYGTGGKNSSNTLVNTIDNGNVAVPQMVWKVAVIIPKGNDDLNRVDTSAVVLAVNMPNDNSLYTTSNKTTWRNYIVKVSALEFASNAAGMPLNFFSKIPDAAVATYLKNKVYK